MRSIDSTNLCTPSYDTVTKNFVSKYPGYVAHNQVGGLTHTRIYFPHFLAIMGCDIMCLTQ